MALLAIRYLLGLFLDLSILTTPVSMAQELFVSPDGSDLQAGTRSHPVRTLAHARSLARQFAGRRGVTVTLMDGDYFLQEPLLLTSEDSGSPSAAVVYRAQNEGKAVLSGGIPLALEWEPWRNGIYRARCPVNKRFDRLFADGQPQPMARYPNYDPTRQDVPYRGAAADAVSPERSARWQNPAGGYIHAMHPSLWGGFSFRILGKGPNGDLLYEGGWQNNRPAPMHERFRMVENVFEELDAAGEWFQDVGEGLLYWMPPTGTDPARAKIVGVTLASLVELRGSASRPVRYVRLEGLTFRHTARTFMDNKEPLLRSDWTIYRGGTVLFEGTEYCGLTNSFIDQPGGTAVFVNNYNRGLRLSGLHVLGSGASGVAFVGDPAAVRNPAFGYHAPHNLADLDPVVGPRGTNYPMECILEDSLIHEVGTVDKQAAGVQISMSRRITVRHCSIYDTSRSGININEGTWGGHLIEGCDVFRTVQETGDHGSFNSWGRDRFWVPNTDETAAEVRKNPSLPYLDAMEPVVIRNSRWRCDHGWDIDLDDGSTNYIIENNLLLNGGLKLREGYRRIVRNNILVNNSLHPHVWYPASDDVFTRNVVMAPYQPAGMRSGQWGRLLDRNLFACAEADRARFAANGADATSVTGNPAFAQPDQGDFTVTNAALARAIGFRNFPMDRFGVRRPSLRAISDRPAMPTVTVNVTRAGGERSRGSWMGVVFVQPLGQELSAYGAGFETQALAVESVDASSPLGGPNGLRRGDLVLSINGRQASQVDDLEKALASAADRKLTIRLLRSQRERTLVLTLGPR
ncbi:MAG: PDZ domain-containing protein [Fimbriimonadaceae bacterium]|nr:PDZ domain-containing protein [Fimbriimonadaceae bacterium]